MAKRKTARKTNNKTTFGDAIGLNYIFDNTITDFFLGLLTVAIAVVMIIAMCSYLSTGATDQSMLENLRAGEWVNTGQEFRNYCGSLGAIVSYYLITVNFGLPAFLVPAFLILCGLRLMRVYMVNLWKWFFGTMLVMIWFSVTFAKFLAPFTGSLVFNPGGKHGEYVVQTLENVIGPPGLTAILCIVAVAFLTYLSSETINVIRKAMNPIGYITSKVKFEITNRRNEEDAVIAQPTTAGSPEKKTESEKEENEPASVAVHAEKTEEKIPDNNGDGQDTPIKIDVVIGKEDRRRMAIPWQARASIRPSIRRSHSPATSIPRSTC